MTPPFQSQLSSHREQNMLSDINVGGKGFPFHGKDVDHQEKSMILGQLHISDETVLSIDEYR